MNNKVSHIIGSAVGWLISLAIVAFGGYESLHDKDRANAGALQVDYVIVLLLILAMLIFFYYTARKAKGGRLESVWLAMEGVYSLWAAVFRAIYMTVLKREKPSDNTKNKGK